MRCRLPFTTLPFAGDLSIGTGVEAVGYARQFAADFFLQFGRFVFVGSRGNPSPFCRSWPFGVRRGSFAPKGAEKEKGKGGGWSFVPGVKRLG